ncbi:lachesin [Galendromus occidentalis]|uniref:Lachesin n=1 Tax=Galendromus occidentalis TaxID=34638 RepID=A0AAJ6QV90_9ACAR|nr:lachesin [Galendromus occidentalis]
MWLFLQSWIVALAFTDILFVTASRHLDDKASSERPRAEPFIQVAATGDDPDGPPPQNYQQFYNKVLPQFDNSTATNITTTAGKTVFLPCSVRHLSDKTVSWIRRPKDAGLTVLTVGRFPYTNDPRIRPVHLDNSESWALEIKYPQQKDSGMYECQVSTLPKISRFVSLDVVVGKAKINGGPQLYVNAGSSLNVSCVINGPPAGSTEYVFWYHNQGMLNFDARRNRIQVLFNADQTVSSLVIRAAAVNDSGNYTCAPSNADPDSIQVFVVNNDSPAAMQDSLSSPGHKSSLSNRELLLWMLLLPVYFLL